MNIPNLIVLAFLLILIAWSLVQMALDLLFYKRNNWDFSKSRETKFEITDGETGGGEPITGMARIFTMAGTAVIGFVVLGLVYFDKLPD